MASTARSGKTTVDSGGLILTPVPLVLPETPRTTETTPPATTPTRPVVVLPPLLVSPSRTARVDTLSFAQETTSESINKIFDESGPTLISITDILSEKEFWPFYQKTFLTSLIGMSAAQQPFSEQLKLEYQTEYQQLNNVLKERRTAKNIIDSINFALDIKNDDKAKKLINKFLGYSEREFEIYPETKIYYELLSSIRRIYEGCSAVLVGEEQTTRIQSQELISNQINVRNLNTIKKTVPLKKTIFETNSAIFSGLTNDKIMRLAIGLLSRELNCSRALTVSNIKTILREKYSTTPDNNPFDNLFGDNPSTVFGLPRGNRSLASKINFKLSTGETVQALESTFLDKKQNPSFIPGSKFFQSNIIDGDASIENLLQYKSSLAEVTDDIVNIFKEITQEQALAPEFMFSRAVTAFANSLSLLRIEDASTVQRLLFALMLFGIDNPDIKIAAFHLFLLIGIKTVGPTAADSTIFKNVTTEIGSIKNILGTAGRTNEVISGDNIDLVARNLGIYIENKLNEIFVAKPTETSTSVFRDNTIVLTPGTVTRLVEYAVNSPTQNIFTTFAEFLIDCDIAANRRLGSTGYFLGREYGREETYTKFSNVSSITLAFLVFEIAGVFVSKYLDIELAKLGSTLVINENSSENIELQEQISRWSAGDVASDSDLTKTIKALKEENVFLEDFNQLNNNIINKLTKSSNDFINFTSKSATAKETINKFYKSIISEQHDIVAILKEKSEVNKNIVSDKLTNVYKNYVQLLKANKIQTTEQALIFGIPIGLLLTEKENLRLNLNETKARNFGDFFNVNIIRKNLLTNNERNEKVICFDSKMTLNIPVDLNIFLIGRTGLIDFIKSNVSFNRKDRKNISFAEYKTLIKTNYGLDNAEEIVQNHFISDILLGFYSCVLSIPSGLNELVFQSKKEQKQTTIPKEFIKELKATRPELFFSNSEIISENKFDRVFALNCLKMEKENSSLETVYLKLDIIG